MEIMENLPTKSSRKRPRPSDTSTDPNTSKPFIRRRKPKSKKSKKTKLQTPPLIDLSPEKLEKQSNEASSYLMSWQNSLSSEAQQRSDNQVWKFNKKIQTWLLVNCFDSKKVSSEVFRMFLEYAKTIQGGSVERLKDLAVKAIENLEMATQQPINNPETDVSGNETSGAVDLSVLEKQAKRGTKLIRALQK